MKKQQHTIDSTLAKQDSKAFMTELARIDNHGEINPATLAEINGGQSELLGDKLIEIPTVYGIILPPKFPTPIEF